MVEKLRILQLVPRFPFPLDDGGKIGIANIYKEFSKQGNDVFLFSLCNENTNDSDLNEAKKYGTVKLFKHNTNNTYLRIINSFFLNKSIYLSKHFDGKIKQEIQNILSKNKFDVIHADHTCMAPLAFYAQSIQDIPIGLRLHNIEWTIWQQYADELSNPIKKLYINRQTKLLKTFEKNIYNDVNVNFAITEIDKTRALELSENANVVIASAGVNTNEWEPDEKKERNQYELVLATTFRWIHNVNAIEWFIQEVLPLIKERVPEVKLTLIGKDPPAWLQKYRDLGVNSVGYVEKVQPFYNSASLNIAPLFVGGGIRIKILEAMAMGLPVVASPIAAEGIKAGESDGLFLVNSKDEFANKIFDLLSNRELIGKLRKSSRLFVQQNYSWEKNVATMINEYKKIVFRK